jgi:O-antigen/teichoic acid export membrane protein
MENFDLDIIAKKSVKGIFALISRTFLIQVLGIVASFVLTIYLSPASFGVFFIVSSIVVFFNYFSDIGLAASLIQKKEDPTIEELRTTFTVQQVLVLIIIIPCFIFSSQITSFFHLANAGYYLFISFLIGFLLSSLKTIPTIILERKLDFHKLVLPEIAENLVYNVLLIVMAIKGFGVNSFTVAVLARSIVGLIVMYYVQPWSVGIYFNKEIFKRLISFGVPFQVNSLLALFKDNFINIYIGKILPLTQVGYIGFAQKWAFLPLRLILDNVVRIIFPSFSRLQHDSNGLRLVIEKTLFALAFCFFPITVGFIMFSPYVIEFIPKYDKWEPAIISLAFFSLNTIFGSLTTPLTNFLNAIGKVKITLYLMVGWTTLTWILTPIFIKIFGFNGVSIASFLVAISTLVTLYWAKKYVKFSFLSPIVKQLIASIFMAVFVFGTRGIITSFPLLVVDGLLSGGFYLAILFILARKEFSSSLVFIKGALKT